MMRHVWFAIGVTLLKTLVAPEFPTAALIPFSICFGIYVALEDMNSEEPWKWFQ